MTCRSGSSQERTDCEMKTLVFVYGTLKKGMSNHHWMKGQRFLGEAITRPIYRMRDLGGYPGLHLAEFKDGVAVRGELWEVDSAGCERLDLLEGVASGEYEIREIALQSPFEEAGAKAYFSMQDISWAADVGECWEER